MLKNAATMLLALVLLGGSAASAQERKDLQIFREISPSTDLKAI